MTTLEVEWQQNEALAQQINREARTSPNSPYVGKYVGILQGQVVLVADTLDEVMQELQRLEPDPRRRCFIEASADFDRTYYIGRSA